MDALADHRQHPAAGRHPDRQQAGPGALLGCDAVRQMLVQNMMTQMTDSAKASASDDGGSTGDGGDDTSGGGTDAVSNSYASQMPDILSRS